MSFLLLGFFTGLSLILAIGAQNIFVIEQGLKRQFIFIVCLICALSDLILIFIGIFLFEYFKHYFTNIVELILNILLLIFLIYFIIDKLKFKYQETTLNIEKNKYILELFYGPTFAFKDYALQFLGSLFSYALPKASKKLTVLGATSGDTGSAAIHAFRGKKDINVFILHPHNRVSEVQRRQMTSVLDENIFNIALEGTFDDCQKIVKELFVDEELQQHTSLTAINSINWARILVQIVYYFYSCFNWYGYSRIT